MRFRILAAALACACALAGAGRAAAQGDQSKQADVKVSGGERDAAAKIDKAQGPEAKLQAAAEFVKKYPKSALRPQVAQKIADEIAKTQDNQLKISLAQTYLGFFTDPTEAALVNDILLAAYINSGQADEAFKMGAAQLAKNPDDVDILRGLAIVASNETIKGNAAYAAQGQQYGAKAIALIEADKKPAGMDDAKWAAYKADSLPALYRATGIIAFKTNDPAKAATLLGKAAALHSTDPGVYLLLSDLTYSQYEQLAKEYQVMPAGASKDAALKQVEAQIDKTIEAYAQAIAITEGNPQYKAPHDQMRQDIENLYKYRHGGSTQGLQQVIDRYKRPATQ
jgi:hypothetical protein